jgi:hypothetical protein
VGKEYMCQKYIRYYDTANNPVYGVRCNCGTTACMNINSINLTLTQKKSDNEFTQEEEKRFYERAFGFSGLDKLKKLSY